MAEGLHYVMVSIGGKWFCRVCENSGQALEADQALRQAGFLNGFPGYSLSLEAAHWQLKDALNQKVITHYLLKDVLK